MHWDVPQAACPGQCAGTQLLFAEPCSAPLWTDVWRDTIDNQRRAPQSVVDGTGVVRREVG
eukprot:8804756-Pyramimonas_sp.AAC.1